MVQTSQCASTVTDMFFVSRYTRSLKSVFVLTLAFLCYLTIFAASFKIWRLSVRCYLLSAFVLLVSLLGEKVEMSGFSVFILEEVVS